MTRPSPALLLRNTEDTSELGSPKPAEQSQVHSYGAIPLSQPTITMAAVLGAGHASGTGPRVTLLIADHCAW